MYFIFFILQYIEQNVIWFIFVFRNLLYDNLFCLSIFNIAADHSDNSGHTADQCCTKSTDMDTYYN